jgi:hypothetical protein
MSYKQFDLAQDVASVVSAINEVVYVSSSLFSNDLNIKFYKNISSASAGFDLGGYFETVYDSSPTSSLSTPLFDMTYGFSTGSSFNVSVTSTSSFSEKIKIYRQMASALLGDPDATFTVNNSSQPECFFIMIKRNLMKDEVKKGSVSIILNQGTGQITGSDNGAVTGFKQTVGGDYAPLKFSGTGSEVGQVWYQAGIIVIPDNLGYPTLPTWSGSVTLFQAQSSGTINQLVDGLRRHVENFSFHNQTNLYSTVYFCRATNQEFNYSSNPTFVDSNKRIRVTSGSNILQTRTYITTIGLYDPNDNLLAVAKVNKPITKSPDNESVFRVRLDY